MSNQLASCELTNGVQTSYSRFENSKSQMRVRDIQLTDTLQWADYKNSYDNIVYQNDKSHALSLYLTGGHETQRLATTKWHVDEAGNGYAW